MNDDLEVRVTNDELLRILAGREMTLQTTGGTRVKVRLHTTEELLAYQEAAISAVPNGAIRPRRLSRDEAADLTTPIPFESLIGRQP
jgi:hypothetical protein